MASSESHRERITNSARFPSMLRSASAPRFPSVLRKSARPVSCRYSRYASASSAEVAPRQVRAIMAINLLSECTSKQRLTGACYWWGQHLSRAEYWCYTSGMPQPSHAPAEPLELPFKYVGGDPAIDFVNTVDWTSRGPERDRLFSFERLLEWAEGAGILTRKSGAALRAQAKANPRHAIAAHRNAITTRHILWKLFSGIAQGRPTAADREDFNRLLARALPHLRV